MHGLPMRVITFFEREREFDEESYAVFDVLQVDHFAGRVHVAQGDRYQSCGDTGSANLKCAGIRSRRSWVCFELMRDFEFLGALDEAFKDLRVDVGTATYDRAAAQFRFTVFAIIAIRMVSGVADVDGDGDVGIY